MQLQPVLTKFLPVLIAMALAVAIETIVPLRKQSRTQKGRLWTNLALTVTTLLLGLLLNASLALGAAFVRENGVGFFQLLSLDGVLAAIVAVIVLDGVTYLAHVSLHKAPILWRMHLVHHVDLAIDATTALRQHPFEGVVRFAFTAAVAWTLGVAPAVIATYRLVSSLNSVCEHANIRVPRWLDRLLVIFWVTPDMHKIHHSRLRSETDSNYANLFSLFDRLFGTFTPTERAAAVPYGIEGYDDASTQNAVAIFLLPLRRPITVAPTKSVAIKNASPLPQAAPR
jgi:sterol desaturase/sphingolipid hydroxylase (fatty acid hydroxylase superfamily)